MKFFCDLKTLTVSKCVALGYFDGIHTGHQKVISKAVEYKKQGLVPTVFTFLQNPKFVLSNVPENHIMTFNEKKESFEKMGIEILYAVNFEDVRKLTPEEFVIKILVDILKTKVVVCGFNYHFGYKGIANAENLKKICSEYGIRTHIIKPVLFQNKPVSSTRIREAIGLNDTQTISRMLGIDR